MAQLQIHSWSISSFQWAQCWNLSVEGAVGTLQWFQHYCVFASWSLGVACIPAHLVMLCSSQESRAGSSSAITQHCSGPSSHQPHSPPTETLHGAGLEPTVVPNSLCTFAHQAQFPCAKSVVSFQSSNGWPSVAQATRQTSCQPRGLGPHTLQPWGATPFQECPPLCSLLQL